MSVFKKKKALTWFQESDKKDDMMVDALHSGK